MPRLVDTPDYGRRAAILLGDLARLEGRAEIEVLHSIRARSSDGIRFRLIGPNLAAGPASVQVAHEAHQAIRDLLLAATRRIERRPLPEPGAGRHQRRSVEAAAALARVDTEQADHRVVGLVTGLHRASPEHCGEATVTSGAMQSRQLRGELGQPGYATAVEAHLAGSPVRCVGRLVREGRQRWLRDVTVFEIA